MSGIYEKKQSSAPILQTSHCDENTLFQMSDFITFQSNLTYTMIKCLLDEILEYCGANQAKKIAYSGGFFAGEDFLLKHLNLQDTPETFCQNLICKNQNTWFPSWDFKYVDENTGCFHIAFDGMRGCCGYMGKKPPLQCEFMQGYLHGILECYTGGQNELKVYCGYKGNNNKQQCLFEVLPQIAHGRTGCL